MHVIIIVAIVAVCALAGLFIGRTGGLSWHGKRTPRTYSDDEPAPYDTYEPPWQSRTERIVGDAFTKPRDY